MTTTDWPFAEAYRVDLPPTQVKAAIERCKKKNIVDLSAPCEETQNIIQAVFNAYSKKKERARAASSKSRAAKGAAEAEPLDIEVEPTEEAACVVCEVVAEPPIVAEPPAPEPAAAAPPKAASSRAAKRVDNVAAPAHPAVEAPAPAPKRPAASEAPTRRRGGLCEMVSNALPGVDVARTSSA